MSSIKPDPLTSMRIQVGSLFAFIFNRLMQLIFLFIVVGYHNLSKGYAFLEDVNSSYFQYLIGIPVRSHCDDIIEKL